MDQVILIDKPSGWTSFDVVAKIRSDLRKNSPQSSVNGKQKLKVGHSGTLDPFATGLLIILIGSATKRQDEFMKQDKVYEATFRLGAVSTTGDPEGEITERGMLNDERREATPTTNYHLPSTEEVQKALAKFVGEFTESWAHVQHSGSTEVSDLAKVKGKNILESATPQAQEKINSALKKSEELPPAERAEFMKSVIDDTFRIAVSFLNEEAEIVKNALGTAPAERLLEFCKAELGIA
jgi:tRNA pseudouridine(55) synthase